MWWWCLLQMSYQNQAAFRAHACMASYSHRFLSTLIKVYSYLFIPNFIRCCLSYQNSYQARIFQPELLFFWDKLTAYRCSYICRGFIRKLRCLLKTKKVPFKDHSWFNKYTVGGLYLRTANLQLLRWFNVIQLNKTLPFLVELWMRWFNYKSTIIEMVQ